MYPKTLKASDLIDLESEIHYAFHKSLQEITQVHNHDFYELFLIIKGKAYHNINGMQQILNPGDLVFIRPEDIHNYGKKDDENCELINVAFPASTIMKLFDYLGEGFQPERLLNVKYPPGIKLSELETDIIKSRFEALNTISRNDKVKIKTKLRILLAEIFTKYFSPGKDQSYDNLPSWLNTLIQEMQKKENFSEGFSRMLEISRKSSAYLSRSFRAHLNETPTQFLNNVRLNYAANVISNSDEDITAIAFDAGFENLSHFYHLFRKQFKITPREFRNRHQKTLIPG